MEHYLIAIGAILLLAVAIYSTFKRIRSKSSCCSGGDYRPRRKKLKTVIYQRRFRVEGMHCQRCVVRVEEVIGDIHGLSGRVDLKKGLLTVSYAEEVADEVILARLQRAGYFATKAE